MHAKPYAAASKGKIEAFNKYLDKFVAEARVANLKTLEEVQHALERWLDIAEQRYEEGWRASGATCFTDFISDVPANSEDPAQEKASRTEGGSADER